MGTVNRTYPSTCLGSDRNAWTILGTEDLPIHVPRERSHKQRGRP